ncbi:MAG: D-aminoacylase [Bacteroidia bacterium]|nr:D-aminoacylase [Bacteroidia bacterium]
MQRSVSFITILFFLLLILSSCKDSGHYDIIIRNGEVLDGNGTAAIKVDVAINGDEIVKLTDLSNATANLEIDAQGKIISPGFVDLHAHLEPIFELNNCESHLRQGITTAIGGPDGRGPLPFGRYVDSLSNKGIGMNAGFLCGHNSIRANVMELENRAPTPEELDQMKSLVRQSMEEGAFGISTGLKYLPGTFSKIDEVITLSKVAADKGGIYTSHLRDEGLKLLDGVNEAIQIGKEANIPIVLTHHKVVGKPMWGSSHKTMALIDSARAVGIDVMADQYPYAASYTGIGILIPSWARAGGNGKFIQRVQDPQLRDSIHKKIVFNIINDRGGDDLDRVQFARVRWDTTLQGKTLKYWCEREGLEVTHENGADLIIRAQVNGGCTCIFHAMDDLDVANIMSHPYTAVATDGRLTKLGENFVHPRNYGTFPRVLGKYVREEGVLTLPEAIRKMTSFPADRMGLANRGRIAAGKKADIVIFDADTISDKGTFIAPHAYPVGIDHVLVNGKMAIHNGEFSDQLNGVVLKGPAYSGELD